ncbi:MAG: serine/threonine protein kinase [Planctomycetes bacterium]|nr:serine/threonine protein kinase [Planctomycetota bacterium]
MIGTRLGSWVLEREIGRGGMGCVYLARRRAGILPAEAQAGKMPAPLLPERAAVKVLAAHLTFDAGLLARFQREIDVLRQLDHPHIVRLFEAGTENGRHFYAMEYVEGESFESLLHRHGRLPWPEVLDMALQVCQALKHAHDRGVVHRDLKPANLLCGPERGSDAAGHYGTVKLTDFGIAWVFAAEHLTTTGAVVGTAEYLSPEQAAGKQSTRRSDLYSLGVVLYTLLTGRTPFEGETIALLHKHRYAQFERPHRLAPDLPHDLDEVVCQLMEKEPEKRPADAGVLHKRLDSLRRKYERRAGPGHPRERVAAAGSPEKETAISAGDDHESRTGPATLMAKLMRAELNAQNRGGPIKQFFNHPVVVVTLFVLTLAAIIYAFLPPSAERLYGRVTEKMQSDDPDDWEKAIEDLERLQQNHPDFNKEQVAEFLHKAKSARESRQEARNARLSGPMSEAHWFFEKGLRLRQQGKDGEAKAVWRELVRAFKDVPAEQPWVELAQGELEQPSQRERTGDERWVSVRKALAHARQLDKDGRRDDADKIRRALRALYKDDPSAGALFDEQEKR